MLDREKRDHHESTPRRLPIQTPGQGTYGKQQSELDLAWALATPAAGAQLPGVIYEGRCGIQSLISDLLQEGLSFTEAEAGRGSREKEKEVASTSSHTLQEEGGSDIREGRRAEVMY